MDKDLTKAYSSIYEGSLTAGEGPDRTMGTDGVARSPQQVGNMYNKNIPAKKNNKVDTVTRKAINTSARDLGIQGPNTIKSSHEPEGEMVDEMKAPRMQKGAMAYDGPNKERSEAADRVLAKTKKKMAKKMAKEGKFRSEWEEIKLNEMNDHRSKFDEWIDGLVKEGYDIDRWSDEELIDTFIDENNLWKSRDAVESALLESDKKGKGSGKKDACYKKVKASASVWPSAYASGRLVQCRKKGAANYGNSKKEDFSDWRDELNYVPEGAAIGMAKIAGAGMAINRVNKVGKLNRGNSGNNPAAKG
tara:strand:+ start:59 stop:970 length:912 start_codon:yes stop_codon:yes gene_type:complete